MKAFLMGVLVFLLALSSGADWKKEESRILFLIQSIEHLDATFIRNGTRYDGREAAKHLRQKFDYAIRSASDEERETFTAELFIEKIASKSMFTGEAYWIEFPNGLSVRAREWLYQQLATSKN